MVVLLLGCSMNWSQVFMWLRTPRAPGTPSAGSSSATGTIRAMSLDRIAWLVTVGVCLLSAVLLFVAGYQGYGALAIAVGAAAAINLA